MYETKKRLLELGMGNDVNVKQIEENKDTISLLCACSRDGSRVFRTKSLMITNSAS